MVLGGRSDQVNVWADRVGLNHCLGGQDERRMRVRGRSRLRIIHCRQAISHFVIQAFAARVVSEFGLELSSLGCKSGLIERIAFQLALVRTAASTRL